MRSGAIFGPRLMQSDAIKSSLLKKGDGPGMSVHQFRGAVDKSAGKIRKVQDAVNLAREFSESFGAPAILFRLMKITCHLEYHGDLRGEGAGAANILLRDSALIKAVEHSEHAEQNPIGAEQRDGEQLARLVLGNHLLVHTPDLGEIIGPEDFLFPQSAGGDAFGKDVIQPLGMSADGGIAYVEFSAFMEADKTAAEAEKIGGAHDEGLQGMFEVAAGAEFGGNLEQLVKLARLALRGGGKLGVSNGYGAEAGDCCDQRFFFGGKSAILARVNEDRALRARSAKRSSDEHSGRNHGAQRVLIAADGNGHSFSGGDGALRQIGGEADHLAVVPCPEH